MLKHRPVARNLRLDSAIPNEVQRAARGPPAAPRGEAYRTVKSGDPQFLADLSTRVVAAPVSTRLDDEIVILSLRSGGYFSLEKVGARIWELIGEPRLIAELRDAIVEQYGAAPEVVTDDVLELCQHLAELGLVDFVE
jgi:hypothetical protein